MTRYPVLLGLLMALGASPVAAQAPPKPAAPSPQHNRHRPIRRRGGAEHGAEGPAAASRASRGRLRQERPALHPAISLSRGPTFGVPNATAPHFDRAWRRCLPNGCFADVQVGPELLKTLRSRTEPMQLSFKDAVERDAALPLSLHGLVPALDALAKEPR